MKKTILFFLLFSCLHQAWAQQRLDKEKIQWMDFYWDGDSLDPKSAMMVKTSIDTLNFHFRWQFDTGSPYTFMYGNLWTAFRQAHPYLDEKYPVTDSSMSSGFVVMKNPHIQAGTTAFPKNTVRVMPGYGDRVDKQVILDNPGASVTIGTLGLDQFRNGVLIIDFRSRRLGYAAKLSNDFYANQRSSVDFMLYMNRIVLPVKMGDRNLAFFYDSGASLFPVKTTAALQNQLPPIACTDTLYNITTWGKSYDVPGGKYSGAIQIGPYRFKNPMIYVHPDPESYHTAIFNEAETAGLMGNALFDGKVLVLDFTRMKMCLLD